MNYLLMIGALLIVILYSIWTSYSEAKIKYMKRRDSNVNQMVEKGYTVSKRWDCNAITIFIDKKKRVLCFILFGWRKDTVYEIPIDTINSMETYSVGFVKRSKIRHLVTEVAIKFDTQKGEYILRTLYLKGLGVLKTSSYAIYGEKCAKEICDYVNQLKK